MAGAGWRDFVAGEVLTAANVQDYLQDQSVMVFGGTAARGSAIASPSEGMTTYLADSNTIETYSGTTWERQTGGLIPISPTTVTIASGSGSANSVGKVSFTNATNVALDGVFTTRFDDYLIILEMTTSNYVEVVMQYRAGGVNNSTSNVYTALTSVGANNTSSITYGNPATLAYLGYQYSATQSGAIIQVMSPNLAKNTKASTQFISNDNNVYRNFTGGHNAATATQYDGFALFTSGGTFTGSISVYGYNK